MTDGRSRVGSAQPRPAVGSSFAGDRGITGEHATPHAAAQNEGTTLGGRDRIHQRALDDQCSALPERPADDGVRPGRLTDAAPDGSAGARVVPVGRTAVRAGERQTFARTLTVDYTQPDPVHAVAGSPRGGAAR